MKRFFGILIIGLFCLTVHSMAQAMKGPPKESAPLSYGFVVDNSRFVPSFLERVITMVKAIADTNTEKDEAFLITFVDNAKTSVRQEFTSDIVELKDAAENMFIEGGLTTLLDAVRLAVDYLSANAKDEPGRNRVILLITDGDDRNSSAKIETVVAAAKNANVKIIVVGISEEKVNTKLLDRLAKETAGRAFYPKTPKETTSILTEIAAALRGN